eukprot:jgi/Mesvir1/16516/Mv10066-RA.1
MSFRGRDPDTREKRQSAELMDELENAELLEMVITHEVSKLDTLAGLAIKYNVQVADIKRLNGLALDSSLFARQMIYIPKPGLMPSIIALKAHRPLALPTRFAGSSASPDHSTTPAPARPAASVRDPLGESTAPPAPLGEPVGASSSAIELLYKYYGLEASKAPNGPTSLSLRAGSGDLRSGSSPRDALGGGAGVSNGSNHSRDSGYAGNSVSVFTLGDDEDVPPGFMEDRMGGGGASLDVLSSGPRQGGDGGGLLRGDGDAGLLLGGSAADASLMLVVGKKGKRTVVGSGSGVGGGSSGASPVISSSGTIAGSRSSNSILTGGGGIAGGSASNGHTAANGSSSARAAVSDVLLSKIKRSSSEPELGEENESRGGGVGSGGLSGGAGSGLVGGIALPSPSIITGGLGSLKLLGDAKATVLKKTRSKKRQD